MQIPIIIENLEVWPENLGKMTWEEAIAAVKKLGNGWRLPTDEEFETVLYPNRNKIPRLKKNEYLCSGAFDSLWLFDVRDGGFFELFGFYQQIELYVRAVREITGDVAVDLLFRDF